jgi:PGDYG protein
VDKSTSALELRNVDLRADLAARQFLKHEIVTVEFAAAGGAITSRVGPNNYLAGDALITGTDGDRWCVSRARFDNAYTPVPPGTHGHPGSYQNRPRPVLARQMHEAFRCQRVAGGDWLQGQAGDWLLQYAPGDHGVAANARFQLVYRELQHIAIAD